jgi:uncharacterized membrane protein YoaK (UPF0700 family)
VSFLGLGQIFTANMTGNTVFLALAVGQRDPLLAVRSVVALGGFCVGAIVAGRIFGEAKAPQPWAPRVTRVLMAETVLLGAFNLGWVLCSGRPSGDGLYLLIGSSSVAMGLQSAVGRHLAVPGLTTTVVTTALTGLMAETAALGISGTNQKRWAWAMVALFSGAAIGAALLFTVRDSPPFLTTAILVLVCVAALTSFQTRGSAGLPPRVV